MTRKSALLTGTLAFIILLLTACAGPGTPTVTIAPAISPTATPVAVSGPTRTAAPTSGTSGGVFETKSSDGGSVTVDVKPTALGLGQPLAFDVAMNTHSVDLADDMTKIAVLRDDAGKEYKPTAWDGPGSGGHHRSGTLVFPALTSKPKYIELVIKGLAKVPERVFKWELP